MTLAATITSTGISAPSYQDILASLVANYQSIYGSDAVLTPDTQDGQLLAVFAQAINDCNQVTISVYNAFSPAGAQGAALSSLVKINGIARQVASKSTATVTITGQANTIISNGIVGDNISAGTQWALPATVTIPGGGTINVTATCTVAGATSAAPGTLTAILTPTLGWQSVTNAASATVGQPIETDSALRQRQAISTEIPAESVLDAMLAAVKAVAGVSRVFVDENSGSAPDSNGVPGHSVAFVVEGGNATAIATAIAQSKTPGTGTVGTTSVVIVDPVGIPNNISFYILGYTNIYVSLTIKSLTGYTATIGQEITTAIVNYINTLAINGTVYYNKVLAVAELPSSPDGVTFNVTALTMGTAPSPVGTSDIAIAFGNVAQTVSANVVLTVT